MNLTVAGAQMCVTRKMDENVKTIERAILYAASVKADILLTPEGSVSGYTHQINREDVMQAVHHLVSMAASARLGLALGTCYIEDDGLCYNQIRFYLPTGEFVGFHAKILRCGTMTQPTEGEIHNFATTKLRTFDFQGINMGALICNDMWANPCCTPMPDTHLSQQLSAMGASVIFHAVNGARSDDAFSQGVAKSFHETNLLLRARAGHIWIVTVDNAYPPTIGCSSYGGVITPFGEWKNKISDRGEQFFVERIDFDPS